MRGWWLGVVLMGVSAGAMAGEDQVSGVISAVPEGEGVAPISGVPEGWTQHEPGQVGPSDPYWKYELYYHQQEHKRGLEEAKAALALDPGNGPLSLHVSRFMFQLGEEWDRSVSNAEKVKYYEEMIAILDLALARNPGDLHLRFARAVSYARLGTTRGVLASLRLATLIESEWLAVAQSDYRYASIDGEEVLPCDAYLSLGVFYRLVPDMWIIQLLSGTRGSLDKSVSYMEQADSCRPKTIRYRKELGVSLICKGQRDKDAEVEARGIAVLKSMKGMPTRLNTEPIDLVHAERVIADPSLACSYSRDGVQDLDTSKLDK